ncbi:hypothetical protein CK203_038628 [Vitis vinifera]|uniref:Uncharacterized protein n=1 Tax=Vitis vinifera TaxID=29760 RepID=A0A438HUS2_VITVI|nr:hypothetical protein CK203_038628 [Vitis vinifera]
MTKKGSLVIAHNYWFEQFGDGCFDDGGIFMNSSYVDRALVRWKGREFEYKSTLGLVKSIDLSSNKTIGEIPEEDFNSCSCHISMIEYKSLCPSLIYD